jgi:plasmid stabilization system protein ParE
LSLALIDFSERIADDIDRIAAHLAEYEVSDASDRVAAILNAIDALEYNPLIGRSVESGDRELVVGRDARGCLVLYRYFPGNNTVYVLGIRAQREAGYVDDLL